MKRKTSTLLNLFFLVLISFGIAENAISQTEGNGKIVAFHPSAGNSITLSEKKEFFLFSEYNDSLFESAHLVKYSPANYAVLFKNTKGRSFEKPISVKELDCIYEKIEKVKPAVVITPTEDYVEKKALTKEEQKKIDRIEGAQMIAEISFQIIYTLLVILANN